MGLFKDYVSQTRKPEGFLGEMMVNGMKLSGYAKWAFKNMLPAEKKYPKECEEARQDSFRRILAFLEGWN